jgi:hypothetical protein
LLNPDTDPDPTLNFLRIASLQLSILQKLVQQNFALLMQFLAETVTTLRENFFFNLKNYIIIEMYKIIFIKLLCFLPMDPDSESGSKNPLNPDLVRISIAADIVTKA